MPKFKVGDKVNIYDGDKIMFSSFTVSGVDIHEDGNRYFFDGKDFSAKESELSLIETPFIQAPIYKAETIMIQETESDVFTKKFNDLLDKGYSSLGFSYSEGLYVAMLSVLSEIDSHLPNETKGEL